MVGRSAWQARIVPRLGTVGTCIVRGGGIPGRLLHGVSSTCPVWAGAWDRPGRRHSVWRLSPPESTGSLCVQQVMLADDCHAVCCRLRILVFLYLHSKDGAGRVPSGATNGGVGVAPPSPGGGPGRVSVRVLAQAKWASTRAIQSAFWASETKLARKLLASSLRQVARSKSKAACTARMLLPM